MKSLEEVLVITWGSFNYTKKKWISFHSYAPQVYIWDRNYLIGVDQESFWRHNDNNRDHQVFYGKYYPMSVDFIISDDRKMPFELKLQEIESDASVYTENNKQYNRNVTFNKYWIYDTHQSTGIIDMVPKDTNSDDDVIFIGNGFQVEPNQFSHTSYNDGIFFDKYFTQRFIFDNFEDRKYELALKYVNTLTNLKIE